MSTSYQSSGDSQQSPSTHKRPPKTLSLTEANAKADDEGFVDWDERLEPSIVQTCRTIYGEAAPILYANNTFCFRATPALLAGPVSRGDDIMFWDEPAAATAVNYDEIASPLPAFLRAIGPRNATHLRSIVLEATDTTTAAIYLLTALPLTITHLPNLMFLTLYIDAIFIDWGYPFAPDPTNDEEMANGPLEPMYAALLRFVGQWQFVEDDALEALKEVEWIVEEKSWENLEKVGDRRWMKTEGRWRRM
ncbi:MAG: hypothetical protein L6R37_008396 [Teloschistes peruensis]|nr:MAG: hypothetical protein L6R37_008396 [Teloschistes peruensis]